MTLGNVVVAHPVIAQDVADELGQVGGTRMGVTLRRIATQTLPDNADTTVSWDTETQDTHGLWTAGAPTVVTIPTGGGGLWMITFGIVTASAAVSRSLLAVAPSAGAWAAGGRLRSSFGAAEDTCVVSCIVPLADGNTFTCLANVNMTGASTMTATLTAYRVGL